MSVCKIFVNVPEIVAGTASVQISEDLTVCEVITRVCEKFHLENILEAPKYALIIKGLPGVPRYLPQELPLMVFLPKKFNKEVRKDQNGNCDKLLIHLRHHAQCKLKIEFVKYSTKIIIIGIDRENITEEVDFCKERALENIIAKLAVEYLQRPKDLYLVSPSYPNKEISLTKTLLGEFVQRISFRIELIKEDVLFFLRKRTRICS